MKKLLAATFVALLMVGCGEGGALDQEAVDEATEEINVKEREAAGLPNTPVATTPPKVEEEAKPVPMSAERIKKQYELADALFEEGEYLEAKKRMTRAYASFVLLKEKDPEDRDEYLLLLCKISEHMSDANDLIKFAEELGDATYLGRAHLMKEDYDKAIAYFKKAEAQSVEEFGPETAMSALSYGDIGSVYHQKGEYDKAIEYFEKALVIILEAYGPENYALASYYNSIALAYDNKGEYDKAIGYYEKDLAISLKTLGPEHPDVGMSYYNLGATYAEKGEKAKAMAYLLKAKAIMVKQLGADHPTVKKVQSWIDKVNRE